MKQTKTLAPPRLAEGKQPTQPQPIAVEKPVRKKKSRAGRKKERMQISVRIDQVLMDLAHDAIASRPKDKIRITDLLERGLQMALRDLGRTDPVTSQARLLLNDAGVEFSRWILQGYALKHFPTKLKTYPLSPSEQQICDSVERMFEGVSQWPHYQERYQEALEEVVMEAIA